MRNQQTILILRSREQDIQDQINILDKFHEFLKENGYKELWTWLKPVYGFLERYLGRTADQRKELEEREAEREASRAATVAQREEEEKKDAIAKRDAALVKILAMRIGEKKGEEREIEKE